MIQRKPWILIDTDRVTLCREPESPTWWIAYDDWVHEADSLLQLTWSVLTEFKTEKYSTRRLR